MADKTLKLEVITPERVALQDESTSVIVPGVDGELGIWPNHAPLLAGLKPGVISYKTASGTEKLVVSGGFVEIANNTISVIAPAAEKSTEIDFARAEEAKKRAEDKLSQSGMDDKEVKLAEAKLHRALVRIGTVGK